MVVRKALTFKALAHKAARLNSVSAKAALGAMVVVTEIPVIKPTVAIASMTVGASAASIRKALRISPFEREMIVGGALTLSELTDPFVESNEETVAPEALAAEQPISAEHVLVNEKRLFEQPRMTVDDVLEVYTNMTPSEQIALGRAIGVERVWLPRQRQRERNGAFA